MSTIVDTYYTGGRLGALVCVGLALLAIGVGVYLVKAKVDFWSGLGWALVVGSALVLVASGAYFIGLGGDHADYTKLLADDAPRFLADERNHMVEAVRSFYWVILGEMGVVLVGIGLCLVGTGPRRSGPVRDWRRHRTHRRVVGVVRLVESSACDELSVPSVFVVQ
jgi:hypothetical protein